MFFFLVEEKGGNDLQTKVGRKQNLEQGNRQKKLETTSMPTTR